MTPSRIWTGPVLRSAIARSPTLAKIVHRSDDFKGARGRSGSRRETFKNHLVGVARRPLALLRRAHRPGEQRAAKDVAGDPWRRRRQLVDPEGDKMRLRAKAVAHIQHAIALF